MTTTDISSAALDVLERATCEGHLVRLPPERLDRKLYVEVNEALARLGGKWTSGKTQAHVFPDDPALLLATVVETGEMPARNPMAYFATPEAVGRRMLELVENAPRRGWVLEPSAGDGALLRLLNETVPPGRPVDAVEMDPRRAARLLANGWIVRCADFLTLAPSVRYAAVVMNPPFTAPGDPLAYIAHIRHAHALLSDDGELVSVAPVGFTTRQDRRCTAFRAFVDEHGSWEPCESGAFKESGTGVNCVLVHLHAGAES